MPPFRPSRSSARAAARPSSSSNRSSSQGALRGIAPSRSGCLARHLLRRSTFRSKRITTKATPIRLEEGGAASSSKADLAGTTRQRSDPPDHRWRERTSMSRTRIAMDPIAGLTELWRRAGWTPRRIGIRREVRRARYAIKRAAPRRSWQGSGESDSGPSPNSGQRPSRFRSRTAKRAPGRASPPCERVRDRPPLPDQKKRTA